MGQPHSKAADPKGDMVMANIGVLTATNSHVLPPINSLDCTDGTEWGQSRPAALPPRGPSPEYSNTNLVFQC